MADRPILFSAPMVRALLDGRKTQTRRILNLGELLAPDSSVWDAIEIDGVWYMVADTPELRGKIKAPARFAKGDRLWVKEGWADVHPLAVQAGRYSQEGRAGIPGPPGVSYRTVYRVDGEPLQVWHCEDHPYRTLEVPTDPATLKYPTVTSDFKKEGGGFLWDNAMFMPRWASRLTLAVTDVRVQRLQSIDQIDAMAEGIVRHDATDTDDAEFMAVEGGDIHGTAVDAYKDLWNRINGAKAWAANPWVVALTFTVEQRNIDA